MDSPAAGKRHVTAAVRLQDEIVCQVREVDVQRNLDMGDIFLSIWILSVVCSDEADMEGDCNRFQLGDVTVR